jgi:hypothetical protein
MFSPFTDRRLFRALATVRALSAARTWTQLTLDSFVGAGQLNAHIADTGGGWTCDAVWGLEFNSATYNRNTLTPSKSYAQMDSDKGDDLIAVQATVFRGNDDPFITPYQEIGGISFLQKTNDLSNGEGCSFYAKAISAAQCEIYFERRSAVGAIQQQVLLETANIAANTSAGTFRAEVIGLTVTCYRNGVAYAPIALTADLRDGTHRRAGIMALTGDPSGRFFMDLFRIETTTS